MFAIRKLTQNAVSRGVLSQQPQQQLVAVRGLAAASHAHYPDDVGVLAADVYFPTRYVSQKALEGFDGVSSGKYQVGLEQTNMAFVDDREDIYSMSLTATQNLLDKYDIDPKDIGRLEVGTETLLDKSKSIKSVLMSLFEPHNNHNIEGVCRDGVACLGFVFCVLVVPLS
jgi:hydroxymethylglutaryl-CoA synthase